MQKDGSLIKVNIMKTPYADTYVKEEEFSYVLTLNANDELLNDLKLRLKDGHSIIDLSEYRVQESA